MEGEVGFKIEAAGAASPFTAATSETGTDSTTPRSTGRLSKIEAVPSLTPSLRLLGLQLEKVQILSWAHSRTPSHLHGIFHRLGHPTSLPGQ